MHRPLDAPEVALPDVPPVVVVVPLVVPPEVPLLVDAAADPEVLVPEVPVAPLPPCVVEPTLPVELVLEHAVKISEAARKVSTPWQTTIYDLNLHMGRHMGCHMGHHMGRHMGLHKGLHMGLHMGHAVV